MSDNQTVTKKIKKCVLIFEFFTTCYYIIYAPR